MAIMVGTGRGATAGVLVRDAEALERLERVDTLVVDKTGTLTEGRPKVVSMVTFGINETEALGMAAALERSSEHPLAAAVLAAAQDRQAPVLHAADFHAVAGRGVRATVKGVRVLLGNAALLAEGGISVDSAEVKADELRARGQTVMYLAIAQRLAALVGIEDPIKPTTPAALAALGADGLHVVMLTGDSRATAHAVAATLKLYDVRAEVLPEGKRDIIRQLQREGRVVAMAGDGINDAPALAEAAVGIAMGTGTDIAIQSAGITLVKGDLRGIVRARRLSRATMRNIRQNLLLAFLYNALGVPIAAGVLYPLTGALISPIWASAAMTLSSVSVIGNALRLRNAKL
jgi:Cu+-exporting ATPase